MKGCVNRRRRAGPAGFNRPSLPYPARTASQVHQDNPGTTRFRFCDKLHYDLYHGLQGKCPHPGIADCRLASNVGQGRGGLFETQ